MPVQPLFFVDLFCAKCDRHTFNFLCYRPQTKLQEDNVLTHVCVYGVYPSMQQGSKGVVCIPACNGAGRGYGVYPSMQLGRQGCVSQHAMWQAAMRIPAIGQGGCEVGSTHPTALLPCFVHIVANSL